MRNILSSVLFSVLSNCLSLPTSCISLPECVFISWPSLSDQKYHRPSSREKVHIAWLGLQRSAVQYITCHQISENQPPYLCICLRSWQAIIMDEDIICVAAELLSVNLHD